LGIREVRKDKGNGEVRKDKGKGKASEVEETMKSDGDSDSEEDSEGDARRDEDVVGSVAGLDTEK
jgi:hypothetical protein